MAQLGARLDGIEEVVGSNPIGSTKLNSCSACPGDTGKAVDSNPIGSTKLNSCLACPGDTGKVVGSNPIGSTNRNPQERFTTEATESKEKSRIHFSPTDGS